MASTDNKMARAMLFTAGLLLLTAPAFAGAPVLNVERICKTRDAEAKILKSTTGHSIEECVHGEEAAKQALNSVWDKAPARSRNLCMSDARALGTMSYLDLLTCLQMDEDLLAEAKIEAGARKNDKK
jgi:hypothetical protein